MHDIGVIPGDGIGVEVTDAAITVCETLAAERDIDVGTTTYDWGSSRYLETENMMPSDGLERLAEHDAILLGAIGHPEVPDHVTLNGLLLPIRKGFDQFVCKRPSVLRRGVGSPVRGCEAGDIDFVTFRENTEGEYADVGGREHRGFDNELAIQSGVFTRKGTERIVRQAFEAAQDREGKLTSVTKSNAQAYSMVFWDDIVAEVGEDFPDVAVRSLLVDRAAMDLIRRPEEFDVIVTSNLFGDVLTDVGAVITGGLGLAPSANLNPTGEYPSMFEPIHGSAPDIAGEGVANPLAAILTGAMMFDHLGEDEFAAELESTVEALLIDGEAPKPPDLGGNAGTDEVVNAIVARFDR